MDCATFGVQGAIQVVVGDVDKAKKLDRLRLRSKRTAELSDEKLLEM
jgi:hypothetical protein